jgi:uncharacterized protein (DUF1684 family)
MKSAPVLAAMLLLSPALAAPPDAAAYKAEIEAFHKQRDASLRRDDGWLTLVGLSWLREGDNAVGSAPKSRVILPKGKAPEMLGVIKVEKGIVTFVAATGAAVTSDGKPVTTMAVKPDVSGAPTHLSHGALTFFVIRRGARFGVRVRDREAETLRSFKGVGSFPIDPTWRFVARFEKHDPPKKVEVPNVLGKPETQDSPGAVVFTKDGKSCRLDALQSGSPRGELFLVFGDETNAKETYGGGRFLTTPPPDKDGTVVVDFNKAINPPCAFTPYATCPLPPAQNRLGFRVNAGEKTYGRH